MHSVLMTAPGSGSPRSSPGGGGGCRNFSGSHWQGTRAEAWIPGPAASQLDQWLCSWGTSTLPGTGPGQSFTYGLFNDPAGMFPWER